MNQQELEDLLWDLSLLGESEEEVELPEELLRAYPDGLEEDEARALEASLATSAAARERLAEVAGYDLPAPPPGLRRRVLDRPQPEHPRWRTRRWSAPIAIAATLLLAVGYALVQRQSGLPRNLEYDVAAHGVAALRSVSPSSGAVDAYPETPVRIEATPRGNAAAGVEAALYRIRDGRLERLLPAHGVTVVSERGTVTFTAPARMLVGENPGTYELFVVISTAGDLPAGQAVSDGDDPAVLLADGKRRLVYSQSVHLLRASSDERDPAAPGR